MKHFNIISPIKIVALTIILVVGFSFSAMAQTRLAVTAGIANLRYGPGTKHILLWQVEKYHPLLVVEKKGEWYRIKDYEGDEAYIHNSLVGKVNSVITVKNKCNVRSKPAKDGRKLFTAERGVPFKVLGKKGNWLRIKHADGDIGWIYKTLVW